MKKILMVLTSVSEIGDTGEKTGYNVAEAGPSLEGLQGFRAFRRLRVHQGRTASARQVDPDDPVQVPSRRTKPRAPDSTTLPASTSSIPNSTTPSTWWEATAPCGTSRTVRACRSLVASVYDNGGVVGAVCHGPAGLLYVELKGIRLV